MANKPPEEKEKKHPWRERLDFHHADQELRAAGWIIWMRRNGCEPVWRKGNVECVQSKAELITFGSDNNEGLTHGNQEE